MAAVTLTYKGETLTIHRWARRLGLTPQTLWSRYNLGWSDERIVTTPRYKGRTRQEKDPEAATIAPHIQGPAIAIGGRWVPASWWLDVMQERRAS